MVENKELGFFGSPNGASKLALKISPGIFGNTFEVYIKYALNCRSIKIWCCFFKGIKNLEI